LHRDGRSQHQGSFEGIEGTANGRENQTKEVEDRDVLHEGSEEERLLQEELLREEWGSN
jgi:hypothetical protein